MGTAIITYEQFYSTEFFFQWINIFGWKNILMWYVNVSQNIFELKYRITHDFHFA